MRRRGLGSKRRPRPPAPAGRSRLHGVHRALVALLLAAASAATAAPRTDALLRDAAALRRTLRYDEAAARLDAALPQLTGDARCEALIARAGLETDLERARSALLEAGRAATAASLRRRADLELAHLDWARGSYRGVETRLAPWARDPDAALLLAQAAIGLEAATALDSVLAPARDHDTAQLLLGWDALQRSEPRRALEYLAPLAARRSSDVLPTALLWKATAEAQLGDAAAAARTAAELRARFALAPETDAAARAAQAPPTAPETATRGERVLLQVAAFEDRANALRYRESVVAALQDVRVEAGRSAGRIVYRVCVGSFPDRAAAETFAAAKLDPRGIAWQVVVAPPERR